MRNPIFFIFPNLQLFIFQRLIIVFNLKTNLDLVPVVPEKIICFLIRLNSIHIDLSILLLIILCRTFGIPGRLFGLLLAKRMLEVIDDLTFLYLLRVSVVV